MKKSGRGEATLYRLPCLGYLQKRPYVETGENKIKLKNNSIGSALNRTPPHTSFGARNQNHVFNQKETGQIEQRRVISTNSTDSSPR